MAIVGPNRVGVRIPAEKVGSHWWHIVQDMLDVCNKMGFSSHYIARAHRESGDVLVLIYGVKKIKTRWTKADVLSKIQL